MAQSIDFNQVQGTTGEYLSNLELSLSGPSFNFIKKKLTMRNGQVAWRVSFLKKKIQYWNSILNLYEDGAVVMQTPALRVQANKKCEDAAKKLPALKAELEEIEPFVTEELFTQVDSNTLVVPPGLWYLCESVTHNTHLNTELPPYALNMLRDYQVDALRELYKYNRAMVELATGLGKSLIILSIALAAAKSGKRAMIVVPTEYLVGQMLEDAKKFHENSTAQGGGRQATLGWDILVTTIQSAGGFADLPDVVILDEAHHNSAESWTKLAMSLSKATHVYGFTATAFRSDGLDIAIHSFAGPIVFSRNVQWGIQNQWLNDFTAFVIRVNPKKYGKKIYLSSDKIQATTAYKILVPSLELMTVARDRLLSAYEKGRKIIVVFKTVEACKSFRKFCADKIDLDVASAQMGQKSKAPMRRFQKGESRILLVNSGLISEGVNIPDADLLIQCSQNSSDVMSLQMLGRILRKKVDGAKKSVVIDIVANGYSQFERAGERRAQLYASIIGTDNTKIIDME